MYVCMREEVRTGRQAHMPYFCVVSGFHRDVSKIFVLLRCYATYSGSIGSELPTVRGNVSVPDP